MAAPDKTQLWTFADFEAFERLPENKERYFELINGEIVAKAMPTQGHGAIATTISGEIYFYLKAKPIGRLYSEAAYRVPDDEHNARQPDISYVSDLSRVPVNKGRAPYIPDLAIEIKSPDDSYREVREKATCYLANGAQLVWLVYPEKRLVEVYSAADEQILTPEDVLDGGELLPGFTLPLKTIFAD